MKLLLDAHTFLWFIAGDTSLSSKARAAIENEANQNFVSIASLWEIAIKNSLGKLPLAKSFSDLIPEQLQNNGIEVCNLNVHHLAKLIELPFHHRDPFDRVIASQCLVEDFTDVSVDTVLDNYGVKRLW